MIAHFKKSAKQMVAQCRDQLMELSPLDLKRKIIQEESTCFQAQLEQLLPLFIQHFEAYLDAQLESLSLFSETSAQQHSLGEALHEFEKHKRDWKSEEDLARGLKKLSTFYSYYVDEKRDLQQKLDLKTEVEVRWDADIIAQFIQTVVQLSVSRAGVELTEPKKPSSELIRVPVLSSPTDEELGRYRAEASQEQEVNVSGQFRAKLEDLQRENDFLKMKIERLKERNAEEEKEGVKQKSDEEEKQDEDSEEEANLQGIFDDLLESEEEEKAPLEEAKREVKKERIQNGIDISFHVEQSVSPFLAQNWQKVHSFYFLSLMQAFSQCVVGEMTTHAQSVRRELILGRIQSKDGSSQLDKYLKVEGIEWRVTGKFLKKSGNERRGLYLYRAILDPERLSADELMKQIKVKKRDWGVTSATILEPKKTD